MAEGEVMDDGKIVGVDGSVLGGGVDGGALAACEEPILGVVQTILGTVDTMLTYEVDVVAASIGIHRERTTFRCALTRASGGGQAGAGQ
ncbi:hypothetical protein GUJ93_ZPchr0013g35839 [Zizania palustris]|uniref:Uncharacterized protein n=1 Tax=Zizania palustris TaxID=103762 RepID=A0A8J6BXJ4_ZIZPA|nr:hypothetical protein GUJ93_ZPchr0013g35839 [Zizania palustris]